MAIQDEVNQNLGERFIVHGEDLEHGLATPIYRYLPVERYFELLERKVNSLSHITMWEDPYEGFIFRAAAETDSEQAMQIYDRFKYYYGQCWTLCKDESDLRWRASGARGTVVRIKTTVGKLCESLVKMTGRSSDPDAKVVLGKIKYEVTGIFDDRLTEERLWHALNGAEHDRLELFFVKREEFKSEDEFRVIVHAVESDLDRERDTDGRFLKYEIDPEVLIDEVLVDPCMPRDKWEQLVCRSLHCLGGDKLYQSQLFNWPRILGDAPGMDYGVSPNTNEIPAGPVFRDYLVNRFHAMTPHARSIWSRVKRVLSAASHVGHPVSSSPSEEELLWVIQNVGELVPNGDSAANCKSAFRHYIRSLHLDL